MSKKSDKVVKGFRIDSDLQAIVTRLIKESGKEDAQWFEDLIHQIATDELVLEKDGIPKDLRKHFGSDLSALKDATSSITSLFINQMNRIAVEKNNWSQLLQEKQNEYEEQKKRFQVTISSLEQEVESKENEINEISNHILQLQNKIDGFDKLEEQLRKTIERLEENLLKNSQELERVRHEAITEKDKFYEDIQELKSEHKNEKDELNQKIVDLVDELKKAEPIKEENKVLTEKIKELEDTIRHNDAQYEIRLTRFQEQAEVERTKTILEVERELREKLHSQNREDMKELYEKIEKLQQENYRLATRQPKK